MCGIKKISVVSGHGSGPIRLITLAQSAVQAARVAVLDHTVAKAEDSTVFSRRGPEIWRSFQHNKEYLELMKARGLKTIKDMSRGDAQKRTSQYW